MESFQGQLTIDGHGTFPVSGSIGKYPRATGTLTITDEALLEVLDSGMSCHLDIAGPKPILIVIGGIGRNPSSTGHPPWAAFEAASTDSRRRGPHGALLS